MTDEWRKEITNRLDNYPLAVRGTFAAGDEHMCRFFLSLLDKHWDCFRSIHIYIDHEWWIEKGTLDMIYKPVPKLESFSLDCLYEEHLSVYVPLAERPNFSDHAPKLHNSRCAQVLFKLYAPYTGYLCMVAFSFGVNTSQIINALPHMPLLVSRITK